MISNTFTHMNILVRSEGDWLWQSRISFAGVFSLSCSHRALMGTEDNGCRALEAAIGALYIKTRYRQLSYRKNSLISLVTAFYNYLFNSYFHLRRFEIQYSFVEYIDLFPLSVSNFVFPLLFENGSYKLFPAKYVINVCSKRKSQKCSFPAVAAAMPSLFIAL